MKFSSMIVGAFAALATAAPVEKRSGFNGNILGGVGSFGSGFNVDIFNGGVFQNDFFPYIFQLNGLKNQDIFDIFNVGIQNQLALDVFSPLFNIQKGAAIGINELLLAHSFLTLGWLHKNNLIANVAFGGVQFPGVLDFGLFDNQFNQFKDFGFGNNAFDVGFGGQVGAIIASSGINIGVGHLGLSGLGLGGGIGGGIGGVFKE